MLPSQHLHRVCLVPAAWAETSSVGEWHVDRSHSSREPGYVLAACW